MERQDIINLLKTEEQLEDLINNHLYSDGTSDYINNLCDARENLGKEFNGAISAKELFDSIGVGISQDEFDAYALDVSALIKDLDACIDFAKKLLHTKSDGCDHEFDLLWQDSHHSYYQCKKCGFKVKY